MKTLLYALCWLWGRVDKLALEWAKRREAKAALQRKAWRGRA